MQASYWIIWHKPTRRFLPVQNPDSKRRHAWTNANLTGEGSPRLHTSERGARISLRMWLQGQWKSDYRNGEDITIVPVPERTAIAGEMEVAEIILTPRIDL